MIPNDVDLPMTLNETAAWIAYRKRMGSKLDLEKLESSERMALLAVFFLDGYKIGVETEAKRGVDRVISASPHPKKILKKKVEMKNGA